MESKAMRRAVRSARAVLHGTRILEFIQRPETRQKLIAAAEAGVPPVTAISSQIVKLAQREAKLSPVKQFVGLCVRAVLEQESFQVAAKGVRVSKDPIFRTGSTYERRPAGGKGRTFLVRMVEALTDQEADELFALLQRRTRKTRT
jgi:hypothetical protein